MSNDERDDIGLHFCRALADGRYDRWVPSWESRKYQCVPTDSPLKLFGGQIPMDEPNTGSAAEPKEAT